MEQVFTNPIFIAVLFAYVFFFLQWGRMMKNNALVTILLTAIGGIVTVSTGLLVTVIYKDLSSQCGDPPYIYCSIWAVVVSAGVLVGISLVILTIVLFLLKRWNKTHGLEIFYDNDDDLCHHFNKKSVEGKDCYFTRLKIINKSKTSAENCRGRLASIKDRNGSEKDSRWTSSELGWDKQVRVEPVSIWPDGDYKYLDIGWVNIGEDVFKIRTEQSSQGIDTHRHSGTYYFHIAVSANGVGNTVKQWFRVDWHGDFSDFKMKQVRGIQISIPLLRHRLDRA